MGGSPEPDDGQDTEGAEVIPHPASADAGKVVRNYAIASFMDITEELGVLFRWNTRARRIEVSDADRDGGKWLPAVDRYIEDLRDTISEDGGFWTYETQQGTTAKTRRPWRPSALRWREMVLGCTHSSEVDPFIVWLEALPAWDGVERAESMLSDLFGCDPGDELARWASRYPMVGAIERAYAPGAKIDEAPVLLGPQGAGKSAWVRSLLPPDEPEWHGDHLPLAGNPKQQAEATAGRVVVEMAEMVGLRRAEIESVKTFLVRTDDGQHRAAYARNPEPSPRRCVFAGTTNDDWCLPNDPTGNRRFVVVSLNPASQAVEPWMAKRREQVWAEALANHRSGQWPTARLPRELHAEQARRNEEHRDRDMATEDSLMGLEAGVHLTMREIRVQAEIPRHMNDKRLAVMLRDLGWDYLDKHRCDGKTRRCWIRNE